MFLAHLIWIFYRDCVQNIVQQAEGVCKHRKNTQRFCFFQFQWVQPAASPSSPPPPLPPIRIFWDVAQQRFIHIISIVILSIVYIYLGSVGRPQPLECFLFTFFGFTKAKQIKTSAILSQNQYNTNIDLGTDARTTNGNEIQTTFFFPFSVLSWYWIWSTLFDVFLSSFLVVIFRKCWKF